MNLADKLKVLADKYLPVSAEESHPDYWVYLAGNVVLTLFFINLFFWILWILLIYKGGIFVKVAPLFAVIFTNRAAADFGYEGYPYEMGVFDGWPENLIALFVLAAFIELCRRLYAGASASAGKE